MEAVGPAVVGPSLPVDFEASPDSAFSCCALVLWPLVLALLGLAASLEPLSSFMSKLGTGAESGGAARPDFSAPSSRSEDDSARLTCWSLPDVLLDPASRAAFVA